MLSRRSMPCQDRDRDGGHRRRRMWAPRCRCASSPLRRRVGRARRPCGTKATRHDTTPHTRAVLLSPFLPPSFPLPSPLPCRGGRGAAARARERQGGSRAAGTRWGASDRPPFDRPFGAALTRPHRPLSRDAFCAAGDAPARPLLAPRARRLRGRPPPPRAARYTAATRRYPSTSTRS